MAKTIKSQELNLLLALERGKTKSPGAAKMPGMLRMDLIVSILIVLVIIAFYIFYFFSSSDLDSKIQSSREYLSTSTVISDFNTAEAKQAEAEAMQTKASELEAALNNIKSYPDLNSSDWKKLFRIAGGRVEMTDFIFNRSSGSLTFTASAGSATRVPLFITELRASGIFDSVSYSGYFRSDRSVLGAQSTNAESETASQIGIIADYAFSVTCVVKAPVQQEDANNG